jgi:hypothetical protein
VDWAPYRYGHWAWIAPWGWTWVDDEPWGFAPFHYGRWALVESRWYWVPGRAFVRPIYAPALVAFVGGPGFHFSVGVGGPGVAWFPLAPGEVYVPWYRTSRAYVNNVNITNTRVNITQVGNVYNVYNSRTNNTRITYINQRAAAVTAVPRDAFVNARPVGKSFVRVDEHQIAEAPVGYRPEEQPVRASVLGAGSPARVQPPAAAMNRQVVATRMPTVSASEPSRAAMNIRTETPVAPQPVVRGQNETAPQPTPRYQAERPVPRPSSPQVTEIPTANRPLVRTAPPVEERPELQRSEQQKFSDWQQQRQQKPAPARSSAPRPASHAEPAHPSEHEKSK